MHIVGGISKASVSTFISWALLQTSVPLGTVYDIQLLLYMSLRQAAPIQARRARLGARRCSACCARWGRACACSAATSAGWAAFALLHFYRSPESCLLAGFCAPMPSIPDFLYGTARVPATARLSPNDDSSWVQLPAVDLAVHSMAGVQSCCISNICAAGRCAPAISQ